MPAALSDCSTWVAVSELTFAVRLADDTCTAGALPYRLGTVYSRPTSTASTISTNFQAG